MKASESHLTSLATLIWAWDGGYRTFRYTGSLSRVSRRYSLPTVNKIIKFSRIPLYYQDMLLLIQNTASDHYQTELWLSSKSCFKFLIIFFTGKCKEIDHSPLFWDCNLLILDLQTTHTCQDTDISDDYFFSRNIDQPWKYWL